jgi:hypothetical protein
MLLGSFFVVLTVSIGAQHQHPAAPPTATDAQDCAQAQLVVTGLLDQMTGRLEAARLSNSPAEMRAAIEAMQASIRDLRTQLAPCTALVPADPHDGHAGHGTSPKVTKPPTP